MSQKSKSKQYLTTATTQSNRAPRNTHGKHVLDTVDDYILAEDIRDIISDMKRIDNYKGPLNTEIKQYIYHRLNAENHPRLKTRIAHVITDMQKQDGKYKNVAESTPTQSTNCVYEYDQLTPSEYKEKQESLTKTTEYQIIKTKYRDKMSKLLEKKNKESLDKECRNENCPGISKNNILSKCESVKRIETILSVYHELLQSKTLWKKVPISPIITYNIYAHQQIYNDFLHIKMYHIDADDKIQRTKNINKTSQKVHQHIAKTLCEHFEREYKCNNIQKCQAFQRHYRDRTDEEAEQQLFYRIDKKEKSKTVEMRNDKDMILQEECDKLHSFFLHSTIKFTNDETKENDEKAANQRVDSITNNADGRSFSDKDKNKNNNENKKIIPHKKKTYVGKKEDEKWLDKIEEAKNEEDGYRLLVQHMGVFRWQSAHGFRTGQNRGLAHLKPIHKNVKQEAMLNQYYKASKDNWNQTLRKSKIFYQSFARKKIITLYVGEFVDDVTDSYKTWKRGECISIEEIVMLKLYTDFDKLQHELKKCFRWEAIDNVWGKNTNAKEKELIEEIKEETEKHDEYKRQQLEQRLRQFWHWRVGLLLILNKYGKKINEENMVLYHGVNAKMILNPVATMAFYGPLSTTSSYHVAKTFATAKGMILKITSQYPRLDYCRAFDASVISDYPEEQEYLIAFIYMRVLEIRTRPIVNDIKNRKMWDAAPLASKIRVVFFALHLFREQMFSMSEHLEYYLIEFLKCNRMDCCEKHENKLLDEEKKKSFLSFLCCEVAHHPNALTQHDDWKYENDNERRTKIMRILWIKFNLFRETPNLKQVIKIDQISQGLKQFFLDNTNRNIYAKMKYTVSFDNLLKIFPNCEEVHYINHYRFDDEILRKLLMILERQKKQKVTHKIEQEKIKKLKLVKLPGPITVEQSGSTLAATPDPVHDIESKFDFKPNILNVKLTIPIQHTHKLKKIVFLYYNYKDAMDGDTNQKLGYPADGDTFFHPNGLDKNLKTRLKEYGWNVLFDFIGENGKTGCKIRIFEQILRRRQTISYMSWKIQNQSSKKLLQGE